MSAAAAPATKRVRPLRASQFHDPGLLKRQKQSHEQEGHQQPLLQATAVTASCWRRFHTQAAAFAALDAHTQQASSSSAAALRVFAEEVAVTGQRSFILATPHSFWQQYKLTEPADRHYYEIIREACPCHLYFDLEFYQQTNLGLDGPALVQLLVAGVAAQLQQLFGIAWHDSHVIELDSSSATKFSRHLIVRLPGLAFADACHAGRFARLVLLRLLARGAHSSRPGQLLVANKDGSGLSSFVDMGVYTRNRAFRLYLSSKFGKQEVLRLTQRFGGASRCPRTAFFDSLISVPQPANQGQQGGGSSSWCSHSSGTSPRSCLQQQRRLDRRSPQQQQQRLVSLLRVEQVDWLAELQQLPVAWQQGAMLQLNPLPHHRQELPQDGWGWQKQQQQQLVSASHGPSPFPLLEQFITSICAQGGTQGSVRTWWLVPGSHCVCFSIKGNRWCANVERQHKSNGVYYVADLAACTYYQKCYDPECRLFKSNTMPLPAHVCKQCQLSPVVAAANNCDDDCDDAMLLQLLEGVERVHQQDADTQHKC